MVRLSIPKKIRKKFSSLKKDRTKTDDYGDDSVDPEGEGEGTEDTESSSQCPTCKDMYNSLRSEARSLLTTEPLLTPLLQGTVLHPHSTTLERIIARTVATRLIQSCGSIQSTGSGSGSGTHTGTLPLCVDHLTQAFVEALESDELEMGHTMLEAVQMDLNAHVKRDPACDSILEALLFYKGFASLVCHRVARRRWLKPVNENGQGHEHVKHQNCGDWSTSTSASTRSGKSAGDPEVDTKITKDSDIDSTRVNGLEAKADAEANMPTQEQVETNSQNQTDLHMVDSTTNPNPNVQRTKYVSLWLQSQASAAFGIDIHPAATIGAAVMFDHGTGVVIGETAVVGDYCTFLHGVTLGGTGKVSGDRHPKVGKGVLIGANASILGNIKIGDGAKIGAGSVVLKPIPHGATAVGAPAKIIGFAREERPSMVMDVSLKNVVPIGISRSSSAKNRDGNGNGNGKSNNNSDRDVILQATSTKSMDESAAGGGASSIPNIAQTVATTTKEGVEVKMGQEKNATSSDADADSNSNVEKTNGEDHKRGLISSQGTAGSISGSTISSRSADADADDDRHRHHHHLHPRDTITDLPLTKSGSESALSLSTSSHSYLIPSILLNCPFRQFRCKGLPSGAVSYECLSSVLTPLCTEDEIGEIYMALLKMNPDKVYIPASVMTTKFPSVAQKYAEGLDDEACEDILNTLKNGFRRGSV